MTLAPPPAPLPPDEAERLAALRRYEILDTPPEEAFDRLARLAADVLEAPVALVSLTDAARQWFKARVGLDAAEAPRDAAFCAHAILLDKEEEGAVMVVEDAARDPRFAGGPLVAAGPRFRFYAGAPIRVRGGHRVGTVCALDTAPRALGPAGRRVLAGLAAAAADQLELRLAAREQRRHAALLAQAERMAGVGGWELDVAAMAATWSAEVYRVHGLEPGGGSRGLEGALDFYPPEARAVLEPALARAMAEGEPYDLELPFVTARGDRRRVRTTGEAERDGAGRIVRLFGTFQDVTERRRAERALKEEEARLRAVIDTAVDGIVLIDAGGAIRRVNPAAERMFGYASGGMDGLPVRALMPPPLAAAHDAAFRRRLAQGGRVAVAAGREALGLRADGSVFPIELATGEITAGEGEERLFVGYVRDVTERERAEAALRESEGRFRSIGDSVPVIVWVLDPSGACTYVNRRWYEYTGQAPGEGEGHAWQACVHPDDLAAVRGGMEAAMARREPFRVEYRLRRRDGAWRWMLDAGAPRLDEATGAFLGYVGSVVDIDERRQAEARVRHLAHHDPLTGLPNRALLQDRLQQALAGAGRHGEQVGLLLLDLDRFKDVNDSLGHDAGDALLREAARRLLGCVRAGDTVARLGGDEFAVVLPRLPSPAAAAAVAGKVVTALGEPAATGAGALVHTAASVGVTVFPGDGGEAGQLLKNADIALYRAKAEGGGGYCFFVADMRAQVERRKGVEDELRRALARGGEIVPFFQPEVRLGDGRVVGFEALARWRHPERGIVPPAEFLSVAEDTGLIAPLGEAVLRRALAEAGAWLRAGLPVGRVAVNVAGAQLRRGGLAALVREALAEAGLPARRLVLEVTEGAFLGRGADRVAEELEALHAMGVLVALDDFGTGHASLTHLKRFPVGMLKVDASFVRDMLDDPGDAAIVRAVAGLGRSLGMRVVAEGVETAEQADWLRLQGCDDGQGFLFGRPMTAEAVPEWLRRWRRGQGRGRARAGGEAAATAAA